MYKYRTNYGQARKPRKINQIMVEVSLTVGKLDASLALLLTKDHHLIEFPTILLPNGVKAGSIVKIKCEQDFETEREEARQFKAIQDEILNNFGKNMPKNPILTVKNVTQTSCVLQWEPLDLGTTTLKNLYLFKDGENLGSISHPFTNRASKLSGLAIDKTYKFKLKMDTTGGTFWSEEIEVTTHRLTDFSGITVCLGDISPNEHFTIDDIQDTLKSMGAHHPAQTSVSVDTTHYICTRENKQNPEYQKASDMNIPIIRPEWLKACEREKRIVGVRDYYVNDCSLPDIFAKNFWKSKENQTKDAPLPDVPGSLDKPVISVTEPTLEEEEKTEPEPTPELATESEKKAEVAAEPAAETTDPETKPEEAADPEPVEPVHTEVTGAPELKPEAIDDVSLKLEEELKNGELKENEDKDETKEEIPEPKEEITEVHEEIPVKENISFNNEDQVEDKPEIEEPQVEAEIEEVKLEDEEVPDTKAETEPEGSTEPTVADATESANDETEEDKTPEPETTEKSKTKKSKNKKKKNKKH